MDLRELGALFTPGPGDAEPIARMVSSAMAEDPLNRYFFRGPEAHCAAYVLFRLIAGYGIRQGSLLATSPRLEGVTGKFFIGQRPVALARHAEDPELRRELWELSETLIRKG